MAHGASKFRFEDLEIWQLAIESDMKEKFLEELDKLSRKIAVFQKKLFE